MTDDFHGMQTRSLENKHLRLDYLVEAGPRIVRLFSAGSAANLLADVFDFRVPTPQGEYFFLGGHRLWRAPESLTRTYIPDLSGLLVQPIPRGVRLSMPADPPTGIAKALELRLSEDRPAVTLEHELRNESGTSVELAPWGITQLRLGGIVILPMPNEAVDPGGMLPNRQITFWPYTSLKDDRMHLEEDAVLMKGKGSLPPVKVGYTNSAGWLAYWIGGILFVKRFNYETDASYPDLGCNAEVYCNDRFIELESLGPLSRLEAGGSVHHTETWELYTDLDQPFLSEKLRKLLRSGE
jgi:hypothetical protein